VSNRSLDIAGWAENVYALLERTLPGAARERQVGDFYRWRNAHREVQLFCFDDGTIEVILLETDGKQDWTATDVCKNCIDAYSPDDFAVVIARSIAA